MSKKTIFDSLLELSGRGIPAEVEREGTKVSFKIIRPSLEIMDQYAALIAKEKETQVDIEKDFRPAVQFLILNSTVDDEGRAIFESIENIQKIGFDLYRQMQDKVFAVLIDRKMTEFETKNLQGSPSSESPLPSEKHLEEGTLSTS